MSAPSTYHDRVIVNAVSINGKVYQLKIKENNYSGSSVEAIGSAVPFKRSLKGENDIIEDHVLWSGFRFELIATTEGQFRDIFTSDWKKYIAELWRDGSIYWCGFLSPDYYSEPWTAVPYAITLDAHDGLGQLKQLDFKNSIDKVFTDKISLADVIGQCLYKIMPFDYLYEGINIFEEHQDVNKSMLTETFVQAERFYLDGMISCYDALVNVLKLCNGQLFQQDGIWWVVSTGARKDSFTRKRLNISTSIVTGVMVLTWTYGSSITYDPQLAITDQKASKATINCWYDTPTMTILPAWKQFTMQHNLGYKKNVFDPRALTLLFTPDVSIFEPGEIIPFSNWGSNRRGGYTCPEFTVLYKNTNTETLRFDFGFYDAQPEQRLKLNFDFNGKVHLSRDVQESQVYMRLSLLVGSTKYYLTTGGNWAIDQRDLFFVLVHNHKLLSLSFAVETDTLPGDGFLSLEVVPGTGTGAGSLDNTVILIQQSCLTVELLGIDVIDSINVITHINTDQVYIPDPIELMFADFPDIENAIRVYSGGIWYKVGSNSWGLTQNWFISGSSTLKPLLDLLADEIGVIHVKPSWMISGQLIGNLKPGATIIDYHAGKKFIMIRFDEDCYSDEWDLDMIEISGEPQAYLKLKQGGRIILKSGGKIKLS